MRCLSWAVLTALVVVGGCKSEEVQSPPETAPASQPASDSPKETKPVSLTILTASETGNYYKAAGELKPVLEKANFQLEVKTSPGSFHNVKELGSGRADLALAQYDTIMVHFGLGGEGKKVADNCHVLAHLGEELVHVVVNKDAGIKTLADLKGKRIGVGPQHSGSWISAWAVMHYLNQVNIEDDANVQKLSYADGIAKLAGGALDAQFITTAAGMPLLKSVTADQASKMALLSLGKDLALPKDLTPVYSLRPVKAGTYPFQAEEVTTLATPSYLLVYRPYDEARVKKLAATIYAADAGLGGKGGMWNDLSNESAKAQASDTPYHSGVLAHFGLKR